MPLEEINAYMESANKSKIKIGLSESDIEKIVSSYDKYGGSGAKAARNLPYHHITILKYWRAAGLKIRKGRHDPVLPASKVKRIIEAYEECNGNASEAARRLSHSSRTISNYWKKAGLLLEKGGPQCLQWYPPLRL